MSDEAALKLSETERLALAEALLESLPPPEGWVEMTENEFGFEQDRRLKEAEQDPSASIPWEEVKRLMRHDPLESP